MIVIFAVTRIRTFLRIKHMPRRSRIIVAGVPVHLIQRGNNRQACFFTDEDYQLYLEWLQQYAYSSGCSVHAYVLMTNHVHLLLTPAEESSVATLMKRLGQRYVQYINRTYQRSGTLWEGRFRSCVAQQDNYLLVCQRYIDLNPVRANLVAHPGEYRWTSYRSNAQGETTDLLTHHPLYLGLGKTGRERQAVYRQLCGNQLGLKVIDEIRQATNGNYALGNDRFKKEIASALGRRVTPGKSGRPRKKLKNELERKSEARPLESLLG
jgi:putative transposase